MNDIFEKCEKPKKILAISLVMLTLFRIWLGVKTPLYLQAGADYDDFLLIRYAVSMLEGNWLGAFGELTLVKGASFSVIIVLNYLLGIPYAFGLIVSYVVAIILICVAFYQMLPNKILISMMYIFLLYSPIMFHEENSQKIYRGGVYYRIFFDGFFCCNRDVCKRVRRKTNFTKVEFPRGICASHFLVFERGFHLDHAFCCRRVGMFCHKNSY